MGIFNNAERVTQLDAGGYQTMEAAVPSQVLPGVGPSSSATQSVHSSAKLLEAQQGLILDAPLCMSCGTAMRTSGSCQACEGCGSTSGCS